MRRTALVMSVALVVAAVAMVPIGGLAAAGDGVVAQQTPDGEQQANENATVASPGQRLSGVLNVGEAELENEVDSRTFGLKVARAASEDAQADVVKEQLDEIEERIEELEARKAALDQARDNGSMSEGEYQARVSEVAAQLEGAEQLADQSAEVAGELPADLLESKGINVDNIRMLKDHADELSGGEVAEIARGIAGDDAGKAPGQAGASDAGPANAVGDDADSADAETETPESEAPTNETAGPDAGSDRGR